jgi:hypothetical protein
VGGEIIPSNLFYHNGSKVTFPVREENRLLDLVKDFDQFIIDKDNSYISLEGEFLKDGSLAVKRVPIVYSCDPAYKNRQMAKLYRLNEWYNSLIPSMRVVTMLTLTTHQRDFKNYFDQYDFLRDSWLKLKDIMKLPDELGDFEYVTIAEPHKTGFVHYHILIFKWVTNDQAARYKEIWNNKYAAGSVSRGVDITVNKSGALRSVKNYLMKYLAKTFTMDVEECSDVPEFFSDSDLKKFSEPAGLYRARSRLSSEGKSYFLKVYHAVMWQMNKRDSGFKGFRAFQPSRRLSKIMSLPRKVNDSVAWTSVSLVIWGESHLIRTIESPMSPYVNRSSNAVGG